MMHLDYPVKKRILNFIVFLFILQNANAQSHSVFESEVDKYAQLLRLPALAVGVARGDSLIFYKGIGSASSESKVPITSDHIFTIASVTKTFTSAVLQQLEKEGKISLNDLIDDYPNNFFNANRWTKNTTIAHVLSHTSESNPIGTNFVYNGSKFNLVFNVFFKINPPVEGEGITRPFTKEIEQRILEPLAMHHTLTRYNETEHAHVKKLVVDAYDYDSTTGKYIARPINLPTIESGPAYGMMSSVADLVKYSSGLNHEIILTKKQFEKITRPFYPNSVHGLGWFTYNFEGVDLYWAYGYGFNDSAILLKVPSKNLTLILLSSCTMPSETARLGYGHPLNSPIVSSFIKNFILDLRQASQLKQDPENQEKNIVDAKMQNGSRIYLEESFALIATVLFSQSTSVTDKQKSTRFLKLLLKHFPNDPIWESTTAIDLMASSNDPDVLHRAFKKTKHFIKSTHLHPAKIFFAGVINEKLGNLRKAMQFFRILADGEEYNEQVYKFDALMKLAKYLQESNPEISKNYLERLIKYKEYISVQDDQYTEAREMFSRL